MLTHRKIWTAIDALARRYGLTPSGLARRVGLDAPALNPSKRTTTEGRPRWPTTESLSKVLSATGATLDEFVDLLDEGPTLRKAPQPIPLIGLTQAGAGGFFDDGGFPVGGGWDQIRFPRVDDENAYALEVTGDSMQPLYRDGDILIVSPNSAARKGDRVVLRTAEEKSWPRSWCGARQRPWSLPRSTRIIPISSSRSNGSMGWATPQAGAEPALAKALDAAKSDR